MKVRGARNRKLAPLLRTARAFDNLGIASQDAGAALLAFSKLMEARRSE